MQLSFLFALAFFTNFSFSQKKESKVNLEIIKYSDTVVDWPTSKIHFILINNSDSPIVVSKVAEYDISFWATYRSNGKKKLIKVLPISLMPRDGIPNEDALKHEILKPGNTKELYLSPQTWGFNEHGKIRIKAIYELNRLNPKLKNIESKFLKVYIK